jgi:thymidylate synthase
MQNHVLLTHADCLDGAGCAMVFVSAGGNKKDIHFVHANGGVKKWLDKNSEEWNSSKTLVIADVSTDHETAQLLEKRGNYVILDHHKTALHLREFENCKIEMEKCGTAMLYEYMYGDIPTDLKSTVDDINDFDMWIMARSKTSEVVGYFDFYGPMGLLERAEKDNYRLEWTDEERRFLRSLEEKKRDYIDRAMRRVTVVQKDDLVYGVVFVSDHRSDERSQVRCPEQGPAGLSRRRHRRRCPPGDRADFPQVEEGRTRCLGHRHAQGRGRTQLCSGVQRRFFKHSGEAVSVTISEQVFRNIYADVDDMGKYVRPRGQLVLEVENYNYVLPAYTRFASFESRNLNLDYIKREFLWYLKGDRFDLSILKHAKMWQGLVNADGGINSNYGQYVFGTLNQFDNAVQTLVGDPDSRRASIVILHSEHVMSDTKDVPCTYSLNFRIRNGYLNMTVRMRSQDAVWGMGNDAPAFSFIHEMAFNSLKRTYPELLLGQYYHSADSFHVYERHFKLLKEIVDGWDSYRPVYCPRIYGPDEVDFLRKLDFSDIPEHYEFTRWLVTFDKEDTK